MILTAGSVQGGSDEWASLFPNVTPVASPSQVMAVIQAEPFPWGLISWCCGAGHLRFAFLHLSRHSRDVAPAMRSGKNKSAPVNPPSKQTAEELRGDHRSNIPAQLRAFAPTAATIGSLGAVGKP